MRVCLVRTAVAMTVLASCLFSGAVLSGQQFPSSGALTTNDVNNAGLYTQGEIDVHFKALDGSPVQGQVVVSLIRLNGQVVNQLTSKDGHVDFVGVPPSEYRVVVVGSAYKQVSKQVEVESRAIAKLTLELEPLSEEEAASSVAMSALPSKVQKEVAKALDGLQTNKLSDARNHLDAAQRLAPKSAEIAYLFGVYSAKSADDAQADSYWRKTLDLNPKHLSALLALGQDLLHENQSTEAMPYLTRAVEIAPSFWRSHALLAQAYVLERKNDDAIQHAQRAIELGHERASSAQLTLVRANVQKGDREQAVSTLETYLQAHPADKESAKYLEYLKDPATVISAANPAPVVEVAAAGADALPVPSNWLPPDVDEQIPPVETGAGCAVDDVVRKAGVRLADLISDVDRFTATESLVHESIDRHGLPSSPEKRKFDYVVSIQEIRHSYLNVEEYRNSNGLPAQFPDGVATNGLPALVLIFHPFNVVNFDMACEGLSRTSSGLAWQVHFKQRADKPNTIRRYRIGADGPSYPVALKGRAWISADTYQIVRLESDLIAPVPQIKLRADHTAIEYGPVKFRNGQVKMWLPQSAEIFYDWKGRRIHRRHSFSNYLLFGVDDKQKITVPKVDESTTEGGPSEQKEKP